MREIELTQGKVVMVSDHRYELLSQFKWYAKNYHGRWYAARTVDSRKTVFMHSIIAGAQPGQKVDHHNGNTLDNQDENLRIATQGQNNCNVGPRVTNKSGYKGVSWHPQNSKWMAQIQIDGKKVYLGCFTDPVEAARIYDEAALQYHGEFAWTNGV